MSRNRISLRRQKKKDQKSSGENTAEPSETSAAGSASNRTVARRGGEAGETADTEKTRAQNPAAAGEHRSHPRVQLPLLVELRHPSLGKKRCVARDVSEGGVYVYLEDAAIHSGAKLKLTLLNPDTVHNQPMPTVEMQVVRSDAQGIGLAFVNKTGKHLWESVERFRSELAIGRDYFQIHLSPLTLNEQGQLLVVQQHGKWLFPGEYLVVGENWKESLQQSLLEKFALPTLAIEHAFDMATTGAEDMPEAATMKIYVLVRVAASDFALPSDSIYRKFRWVDNLRDLKEITFGDEQDRQVAAKALAWHHRESA